jgi:hypothetical protein
MMTKASIEKSESVRKELIAVTSLEFIEGGTDARLLLAGFMGKRFPLRDGARISANCEGKPGKGKGQG